MEIWVPSKDGMVGYVNTFGKGVSMVALVKWCLLFVFVIFFFSFLGFSLSFWLMSRHKLSTSSSLHLWISFIIFCFCLIFSMSSLFPFSYIFISLPHFFHLSHKLIENCNIIIVWPCCTIMDLTTLHSLFLFSQGLEKSYQSLTMGVRCSYRLSGGRNLSYRYYDPMQFISEQIFTFPLWPFYSLIWAFPTSA